jgi:hypothetical protein
MANSARFFVLFLTIALWTSASAAQDMAFNDGYEELPGDVAVPTEPQMGAGIAIPSTGDQSGVVPSDPTAPFAGYDENGFDDCGPELHGHWPGVAPIESTGTWLRRGFWYAEVDGVIWNRLWNRDDKLLAADDIQVEQPDFFSIFNPDRFFTTNRLMYLESAHPGQDGSVRFTLGNFLFRDSRNRDHTMEFTVFGGGDWNQERVISARENFGLFVPFYIDGTALVGNQYDPGPFDQSTRQSVDYSSDYKSFEWNYMVKSRLRRDQLIMDANGQWHRSANSGFERHYLAGLRFMNMGELLDWRAEDIRVGASNELGNDGRYKIETDNDMFGFQLGTGLTYQAPRWSLGFSCKGGIFANDATGQSQLDLTVDDVDDFSLFLEEDELSFIGEARLTSRFHITPNVSLRASYELMFMESVAMAPYQATFIPEFAFLDTTGDPFYHGASFGFESYW